LSAPRIEGVGGEGCSRDPGGVECYGLGPH
jgi:hypothetical protein